MIIVQLNKETIFTFDGSTHFFIVLMFFPCFSPSFFIIFPWLDRGNADKIPTSEECEGVRHPPHPLATSLITVEFFKTHADTPQYLTCQNIGHTKIYWRRSPAPVLNGVNRTPQTNVLFLELSHASVPTAKGLIQQVIKVVKAFTRKRRVAKSSWCYIRENIIPTGIGTNHKLLLSVVIWSTDNSISLYILWIYIIYWDLNLEFQILVALRVITTSEWSWSELL